ncbi:tRNA (adenosine(37)-N6)-threonylcarbamoyltransferase complex dimerization subunit type 1 TsaB [Isoalcanivorax indicus]|uniref:tRNA (adenosine(37)-N6)-threonylcarbamoyltransferase complex dimerization subunit type 1 TsaB n=1 Tax=Isoalcanivorax indicus TaxID=2202653 RepID=UPI000DBA63CC|nr:tRNA (adenosine(37)-N6)-threonylcarbamoyltransferase complex dimerization subunit type 1 TsaB [Isoalcanivorax indicus]
MKILAIETATETCSVALLDNGRLLEQFELAPRRQTERVLPMVASLLAEAGISRHQLDGIAFGQGPGAFTGVRVAVAVTQGLAFALDRPVMGISTLASAALAALDRGLDAPLLIAFDARMDELYLGAYRSAGTDRLEVLLPDCLAHPQALPVLPKGLRGGAGSGGVHRAALQAVEPALANWDETIHPRAGTVARLAAPRLAAGEGVPAEQALPVYLRDRVVHTKAAQARKTP